MGKKIIVGGVAVLVLLGVGAAVGRSWMRANAMRTKIYRPLQQEVVAVEEVVHASSLTRAVPSTTYMSVKKDPLWEQVPAELRKSVQDTYDRVWDCQSEMVVVSTHSAGMAAMAAKLVRKEADDQAWIKKVSQSTPGPAPKGQWPRHAPVIDSTDPAHPRITMPGGPVWRLTDWLNYPENIANLDKEWGEDEFLFLSEAPRDKWDNRITRADLRKAKLTLEQFMANLNRSIENQGRMAGFRLYCRESVPMLAALRTQLEEKSR